MSHGREAIEGGLAELEAVTRPKGYNADNRTDCVLSDGSVQTMKAALAERSALRSLKGRARMDAAFRMRAGMIGVLQSCLCDYPFETYTTESGHHEKCPATRVFRGVAAV